MVKNILMILMFAFSSQALADKDDQVLLTCNLSLGETAEAKVILRSNSLILQETSSTGDIRSRRLSKDEWNNKQIRLHSEGARADLSWKYGGWWFEYKNEGSLVAGYADCETNFTEN